MNIFYQNPTMFYLFELLNKLYAIHYYQQFFGFPRKALPTELYESRSVSQFLEHTPRTLPYSGLVAVVSSRCRQLSSMTRGVNGQVTEPQQHS